MPNTTWAQLKRAKNLRFVCEVLELCQKPHGYTLEELQNRVWFMQITKSTLLNYLKELQTERQGQRRVITTTVNDTVYYNIESRRKKGLF